MDTIKRQTELFGGSFFGVMPAAPPPFPPPPLFPPPGVYCFVKHCVELHIQLLVGNVHCTFYLI